MNQLTEEQEEIREVFKGSIKEHVYIVEYPGFISNEKKALNTLNGEEEILSGLKKTGKIEFSPRSEDVYAHSLSGVIKEGCLSLVLSENGNCYKTTTTCVFPSIFDFQYQLNPETEKTLLSILEILKKRNGRDVEQINKLLFQLDTKEKELLPPPVFSTRNSPFQLNTKQTVFVQRKKHSHVFSFKDVPPSKCKEIETTFKEDLEILKKVFKQRPICTKIYIKETLPKIEESVLKELLPLISFYYKNGPWRSCWVLIGIEPEKNTEMMIYQTVMTHGLETLPDIGNPVFRTTQRNIFDGIFLSRYSHLLQYCDITSPSLTSLLNQQCTRKDPHLIDGWYPKGTKKKIKEKIKEQILSILRNVDLKTVEKQHHKEITAFLFHNGGDLTDIRKRESDVFELLEKD